MTFIELTDLAKAGGPVPAVISDWERLILENLMHSIQLYQRGGMTKEELSREYVWMEGCYSRIGVVYDRAMRYGRMMAEMGGLSREARDTKNGLAQRIFSLLDNYRMDMQLDCGSVKHGKWIHPLPKPYNQHVRRCSVCESTQGYGILKYCPCCGAKMDLRRNESGNEADL